MSDDDGSNDGAARPGPTARDGVRLGGGQGFYGDGKAGLAALLASDLDYVVCEALAELTLAILAKDRQRDESLGYTRDLPLYVQAALGQLTEGRTRLITNAGGINPIAAGRAVVDALRDNGITGLTVATVVGDDLRPHDKVLSLPSETVFASAYLGARPIVEALEGGAHIVITGRVADASLFLAPLVHEFGWAWDDWDRLAAGVVVGHLLECSTQVTGGNYSGAWWEHGDFTEPGLPIADCLPTGEAVITKPAGTGGVVDFDTVREQLLYEVHDPRAYLNPDATADMTSVQLEDLGSDRVRVHGVRGQAPPSTYKGLVCTPAGYAGESRLAYPWPDAEAKARAGARFMRRRAEQLSLPVLEWHEEYFGVDAFGGPTVDLAAADAAGWEPPEVMARVAWRCTARADAAALARESGQLGLGGPPMITPFGRGRDPGPTQLLALEAIAVERGLVDEGVRVSFETV